ncbi:MAG TPA: hypothetical protein VLT85_01085 [Terriglobales bacterium]|nr:hypothetical protein [Terriglobales bacterium]
MPLVVLAIVLGWTLLVIRLICFRTTLGVRTLLSWFALGAFLGTVANPVAWTFFNSYRFGGSPVYLLLINVSQQLLMAAPVLLLLGRRSWRQAGSVGDAFLAAFLLGLGYEFLGAFLAVARLANSVSGFSFLPPGTASGAGTYAAAVTVAGYAYWTGLIALAGAAALRFLRNRLLAYLAIAAAVIVCALDAHADLAGSLLSLELLKINLHGNLLPWLTLAALIGVVVWEVGWSKSSPQSVARDLQVVVTAAVGLKFLEARRASLAGHLRRQEENLAAELRRDGSNRALQEQLQATRDLCQRVEQAPPAPPADVVAWAKRRWLQMVALAAFLFFALLLVRPGMESLANWIWTSLAFATRLAPFQLTLACTVLVLLLLWQYVVAPPHAFSNVATDEVAQFSAERRILQVGLGVAVMALLYPQPHEFIAFQSSLAAGLGLQPAGYNDMQALTLLLLLGWAAGTATARRAEAWRRSPKGDHLRSLVHNTISACGIAAVAWLGLAFFSQLQIYAHANWGAKAFQHFGANGNSILEMAIGALTAVVAFILAWGMRLLAARFEKNFLETAGGGRPAPPRAAAAGAR